MDANTEETRDDIVQRHRRLLCLELVLVGYLMALHVVLGSENLVDKRHATCFDKTCASSEHCLCQATDLSS